MLKNLYRTLIILAGVYIFPLLLHSCVCEERLTYCHTIDTLALTPLDNAGSSPVAIPQRGVIAKALVLRLKVRDNTDICYHRSGWINAAYAMKKNCDADEYVDVPVDISITSNADFDAEHKAGTELRSLFKGPEPETLERRDEYDFLLLYSPADTGTHTFKIEVTMQNRKKLEAVASPVKLLK